MQEILPLTLTLKQLAELDRYNYWIYEQIAGDLGRRVLEVGSGTGNITQMLCSANREVMATDVVPSYCVRLQNLFCAKPNVQVERFDLTLKAPEEFVKQPFDSVVCLNVLEHIEDDIFALEQIREVLKPDATLALLVPAHRSLYGEFDRAVGHFRRYSRRELTNKLNRAGLQVRKIKYFSFAAMLPWLINGRILKRAYLPIGQANLANRLVPLLKLERFIGPPCGLSHIVIAQKVAA